MLIEELNYTEGNADHIFEQISNLPFAVYLSSNTNYNIRGRFDIIAADPETILVTFGSTTKIITDKKIIYSKENPFDILKKYTPCKNSVKTDFPFTGGAIGFFGYDFSYNLYNLPRYIPNDCKFPDMLFGIYSWAIIKDHHKKKCFFVDNKKNITQFTIIKNYINKKPKKSNSLSPVKFQSNNSFSEYSSSFIKIMSHIENGDCYQVNLSQRFEGINKNNPWDIYKHIVSNNRPNFSAFFNTEYGKIVCLSPERFIKITKGKLETNPIKGTIKKDVSNSNCLSTINKLLESKKNRAENLMIVDLLRNDLYNSCDPESIFVDKFCDLLDIGALLHLESSVIGNLISNLHPVDALQHAFPGGSVTGAPKLKAMHISEKTEYRRRNVFCGTIAYISNNGNVDSNIMIRTLLAKKEKIYAWAGGGIIAQSTLHDEYKETIDKLDNIFRLL